MNVDMFGRNSSTGDASILPCLMRSSPRYNITRCASGYSSANARSPLKSCGRSVRVFLTSIPQKIPFFQTIQGPSGAQGAVHPGVESILQEKYLRKA